MSFLKSLFHFFKREKSFEPVTLLESTPTEHVYVAFLDILGFGNKVQNDFESAVSKYDEVLTNLQIALHGWPSNVRIKILSDSIILVSPFLGAIAQASQSLSFATLFANLLFRGGIAYGPHKESDRDGNYYLVSTPLIEAVKLEKKANYPRILLSPDIKPSITGDIGSNFLLPLLYYENSWIVNPFNIMWGTSAASRVEGLKEEYPEYQDKYDWFLKLYENVQNDKLLLPEN